MKYVHVSLVKPHEFVLGGVGVFQHYLKRAVPEMELISWRDYPHWKGTGHVPDYEKAKILNKWLLRQGIVDEDTVAIVDGYWGLGLPGNVARTISVVHGSYFGRFLQAQIYPWGEFVGVDMVDAQFEMWKDERAEVLCVSRESWLELRKAGITISLGNIIYHGIDLDVYKPLLDGRHNILMHGATSFRKGLDILSMIQEISALQIEFMDENSGIPKKKAARLNDAMTFVAPSRHEGNSYMFLEAMACGVPLIAYKTGLVPEMDERCGLLTDDLAPQNFIRLLNEISPDAHNPREWMEENASLDRFIGEWRQYLDV